jgi:hypothetical protein
MLVEYDSKECGILEYVVQPKSSRNLNAAA